MRYIDRSTITVPHNWVTHARGRRIKPEWSFFKRSFEELTGKKCWYSESDNSGSKNSIDHFRPKATSVACLKPLNATLTPAIWKKIDAAKRIGYRFLEFDFDNFRYSCDISNTLNKGRTKNGRKGRAKGKHNFFPLKKGSTYATDKPSTSLEEICLLDPCVQGDPQLLYFPQTGFVEPHFSVLKSSWEYCKVKISVEVYHLNYYIFIEKRSEFWTSCKELIEFADALYIKPGKTPQEQEHLARHIAELKRRIKKKHQFSAVAIDCIKYHKSKTSNSVLDYYFPDIELVK